MLATTTDKHMEPNLQVSPHSSASFSEPQPQPNPEPETYCCLDDSVQASAGHVCIANFRDVAVDCAGGDDLLTNQVCSSGGDDLLTTQEYSSEALVIQVCESVDGDSSSSSGRSGIQITSTKNTKDEKVVGESLKLTKDITDSAGDKHFDDIEHNRKSSANSIYSIETEVSSKESTPGSTPIEPSPICDSNPNPNPNTTGDDTGVVGGNGEIMVDQPMVVEKDGYIGSCAGTQGYVSGGDDMVTAGISSMTIQNPSSSSPPLDTPLQQQQQGYSSGSSKCLSKIAKSYQSLDPESGIYNYQNTIQRRRSRLSESGSSSSGVGSFKDDTLWNCTRGYLMKQAEMEQNREAPSATEWDNANSNIDLSQQTQRLGNVYRNLSSGYFDNQKIGTGSNSMEEDTTVFSPIQSQQDEGGVGGVSDISSIYHYPRLQQQNNNQYSRMVGSNSSSTCDFASPIASSFDTPNTSPSSTTTITASGLGQRLICNQTPAVGNNSYSDRFDVGGGYTNYSAFHPVDANSNFSSNDNFGYYRNNLPNQQPVQNTAAFKSNGNSGGGVNHNTVNRRYTLPLDGNSAKGSMKGSESLHNNSRSFFGPNVTGSVYNQIQNRHPVNGEKFALFNPNADPVVNSPPHSNAGTSYQNSGVYSASYPTQNMQPHSLLHNTQPQHHYTTTSSSSSGIYNGAGVSNVVGGNNNGKKQEQQQLYQYRTHKSLSINDIWNTNPNVNIKTAAVDEEPLPNSKWYSEEQNEDKYARSAGMGVVGGGIGNYNEGLCVLSPSQPAASVATATITSTTTDTATGRLYSAVSKQDSIKDMPIVGGSGSGSVFDSDSRSNFNRATTATTINTTTATANANANASNRSSHVCSESGVGGGDVVTFNENEALSASDIKYMTKFLIDICTVHTDMNRIPKECFKAHSKKEQRRLPLATVERGKHAYTYNPEKCMQIVKNRVCSDGERHCHYAHNQAEINYHPLVYKTELCESTRTKDGVCFDMHCHGAHSESELREAREIPYVLLRQSKTQKLLKQSSNFEIRVYKTQECKNKDQSRPGFMNRFNTRSSSKYRHACSNRIACDGYHDLKDRRRHPDKFEYTPEPCPEVFNKTMNQWGAPTNCSRGDACKQSHTLMEVMYHAEKYKTRVCERWAKPPSKCSWELRCAYKHGEDDVDLEYFSEPISLIEKKFKIEEKRRLSKGKITTNLNPNQNQTPFITSTNNPSSAAATTITTTTTTATNNNNTLSDEVPIPLPSYSSSSNIGINNSKECPGCLRNRKRTHALRCGHVFCKQCIVVSGGDDDNERLRPCRTCGANYQYSNVLVLNM